MRKNKKTKVFCLSNAGAGVSLSALNSSFTSAGPCMLTATWFPVFKLPPCSPLRFPPHPDLSRDEIFPYFPGFRHSLIHRFKREWGWFKMKGKKKKRREKKRGSGVFGDWERPQLAALLDGKAVNAAIFNCKAENAELEIALIHPRFNCRSQTATLGSAGRTGSPPAAGICSTPGAQLGGCRSCPPVL